VVALVVISAAAAAWALLTLFFRKARAWLPYYVLGAAGSALLIVFTSRELLPIEDWLREATAHTVHFLSPALGVRTALLHLSPGSLMVVGVPHHREWTHLNVGLESSGLLEAAALTGLVLFFPAQGVRRRLLTLLLALVLTFAANIIRVLVIVAAVSYGGQGFLEVAHVVLGRVVFFLLAMGIYWFAITRPTLRAVAARLDEGHA
jgi:exosortase family protein XrtG